MIRVALLSTDLRPVSGWGAMTYYLSSAFAERKDIDFQVLLPQDSPDYGTLPFEVQVNRLLPPWVMSFKSPHRVMPFLFPRALVHADVIHAIVEFPYGILAARVAAKAGTPYVISGHGTYCVAPLFRYPDRWLHRAALRGANMITVPSRFTADSMKTAAKAHLNVRVIPNAVESKRFEVGTDSELVRARMKLPAGARIILSVGTIKRRKGFDVLLGAFSKVASEEPDVHLVIVGEGPSMALRELAQDLGVGSRVHTLGSVPESDLIDLYRVCEIFTLLPRIDDRHFEGFGLVFLEAAACGKPVVAARSGGVPDAVLDGETGVLVPEDNAAAAAAAVLSLLRDKPLARKMGLAGKRWALAHSWSGYAEQMVETYRLVLNGI